MTANSPPEDPQSAGSQLEAFFAHARAGFFFILLDAPIHPDDLTLDSVANRFARQRITRVNDALLHLYGVSRDAVDLTVLADLVTKGIASDLELCARFFESGHLHTETRQQRHSGTLLWVEGDYGCFYDDSGCITGYWGSQRDVTGRRQADRALREAEGRYRALFQQSQDAVFILSLDGRLLTGNQRAADMLGYSVEEMYGLPVNKMSAEPGDSDRVQQRLMAGEKLPLYERTFQKKDGTFIRVELNVELVRDEDGEPLHIQSIARDISERRRMEDALRESEARGRALLAAMPDLMFRMHRDGRYLDYHAVSNDDLALPPEQFLGRYILDVMPAEMAQISMDYLTRTLESGVEQVFEYTLPGRKNEMRYFEARMVACAPDEVLTLVRDVTERRDAQQREFDLRLERHRVQLITRFVQDASHEFRTPLAIINNSLFFLARAVTDEKNTAHIEKAEIQIERMTRLVDMLLLISRLDSNSPFDTMPVNLNMLLHQSLTAVGAAPDQTVPTLRLNLASRLPPVQANAEYLLHALTHLLDNALRYTPHNGQIRVTTGQQADWLIIEIQDTGIGMDAEILAHIFERFWRRDDAHTTPGLGLGLPIAQKIIELHGGKIEVQSTPGSGSLFTVFLPGFIPAST